jgi:hypothetical protein
VAAALSLGQDLVGNACVAFSMIGGFEMLPAGTEIAGIDTCISRRGQLAIECI